jgi:hypothetical protein
LACNPGAIDQDVQRAELRLYGVEERGDRHFVSNVAAPRYESANLLWVPAFFMVQTFPFLQASTDDRDIRSFPDKAVGDG